MDKFGFAVALSYLMQGKRVRRHDWHREAYVYVIDGYIEDENGDDFCAVSNSCDILADDWELVAE